MNSTSQQGYYPIGPAPLATNLSYASGAVGSPALPLLTVFTPATACANESLIYVQYQSESNMLTYSSLGASSTCSPRWFDEIQNTTGVYSPGVCPYSWTAYPMTTHVAIGTTYPSTLTTNTQVVTGPDTSTTSTVTEVIYEGYTTWSSFITQCVCCPSGLSWNGIGTTCERTAPTTTSTTLFITNTAVAPGVLSLGINAIVTSSIQSVQDQTFTVATLATTTTVTPVQILSTIIFSTDGQPTETYIPMIYTGPAVEVALGVPIAWEDSDLSMMDPPSAVLHQLSTKQTAPSSSTSSSSIDSAPSAAPASSSTPVPPHGHNDRLSIGLGVGLGVGIGLIAIAAILLFFRRLRLRKIAGDRHRDDAGYDKAELAGTEAEKKFGELGVEGQVEEMNAVDRPVEASSRRSQLVELDGDWHGHEAS